MSEQSANRRRLEDVEGNITPDFDYKTAFGFHKGDDDTSKRERYMNYDSRRILILLVLIRLISLVLVRTEFVPDEFWQSTEVAHKLAFGYGHLTWEWKYGLRSYIFPLVIAPFYEALEWLHMDTPYLLVLIPRLLQMLLSCYGEYCFFLRCRILYGHSSSMWMMVFQLTAWFPFYCYTRMITNTTETALNMIIAYHMGAGDLLISTAIMAVSFVIRPTAILAWSTYFVDFLKIVVYIPSEKLYLKCPLIAVLVIGSLTFIDSLIRGEVVFPFAQFFIFNFLERKSAEFGVHPPLWYIYSALPSILGLSCFILVLIFKRSAARHAKDRMIILFFLFVLSLVGHKEIRFLLPILPYCFAIIGDYISILCAMVSKEKKRAMWNIPYTVFFWFFIGAHVLLNVGSSVYFGRYHQAGIKPATEYINQGVAEQGIRNPYVWILMPCYTVPVNTYMHNPNATYEYFTCTPTDAEGLFEDYEMPNRQPSNFSEVNIHEFISQKLTHGLPDFVMLFERSRKETIETLSLFAKEYSVCARFKHVSVNVDKNNEYVNVLCPGF